MRIVKWNQNGTPGQVIVKISVIERMCAYEDHYCVVFKLIGVDNNGNPTTHVATMTKDELALLRM